MITHPYRGSKYGVPFCTECGVRPQRFAQSGVPILWCKPCAKGWESVICASLEEALRTEAQ